MNQVDNELGSCVWKCPEELTIFEVAAQTELALLTLGSRGDSDEMVADLSELTELDSAGLQLLLSMKKACTRLHVDLNLKGVSEPVAELFGLFGFDLTLTALAEGSHD